MTSVDLGDTRLEYREKGGGEPLVLVHGSASDYRTWRAQQASFAERFRVISYSRRYHWPNAPISGGHDYAMQEHLDDLQALLLTLDAAPAHLVGHSYGAFLCLLLAVRNPELVRTLVLAEPPVITLFVSNTPKPLELLKLLLTRPRTAAAIVKLGATGLGPAAAAAKRGDMEEATRRFGTAALGAEPFRKLPEARKEQVRVNLTEAELLGSGFLPLQSRSLRNVSAPTLLLTGQASPKVFFYLIERLGELLPNTERAEIPGASHIMHEDNAPAYNELVFSFLTRHRAA